MDVLVLMGLFLCAAKLKQPMGGFIYFLSVVGLVDGSVMRFVSGSVEVFEVDGFGV